VAAEGVGMALGLSHPESFENVVDHLEEKKKTRIFPESHGKATTNNTRAVCGEGLLFPSLTHTLSVCVCFLVLA